VYLLSYGDSGGRRRQDGSYLMGTTFILLFWDSVVRDQYKLDFLIFYSLTFCFSAVHFFTSLARDAVE